MSRFSAVTLIALLLLLPATSRADPGQLLPFEGGTGWINSQPLSLESLRNKVVLVDFFDYTSIHSLRALPYLREWYKRYSPYGFTIVSIQLPDLSFSGDPKTVAAAAEHLGITWPLVVDGKKVIATRYGALYSPHLLLFDPNGFRIASLAGEADYTQLEGLIQQMLAATPGRTFGAVMALLPQDAYDKPNSITYPVTDEIRLGRAGNNKVANEPERFFGDNYDYTDLRPPHQDGYVYLQGRWGKAGDAMVSYGESGYMAVHYHAIQVVCVMRAEKGGSATVVVTQNGKPVAHEDAGSDIQYDSDGQSYVTVDIGRAYEIVADKRWGSYDLRLYPKSAGVGVYEITFETAETGSDY